MTRTLFHKIRDGEAPCHKIYEDTNVLAFLDINPATKGHTLIIPKEHFVGLDDTPPSVWEHMMRVAQTLSESYREELGCDGFNIVQSTGEAAEQEIPYVHVHLIPRYDDDEFALWHGKPASDDGLDELAEQLRHDS